MNACMQAWMQNFIRAQAHRTRVRTTVGPVHYICSSVRRTVLQYICGHVPVGTQCTYSSTRVHVYTHHGTVSSVHVYVLEYRYTGTTPVYCIAIWPYLGSVLPSRVSIHGYNIIYL